MKGKIAPVFWVMLAFTVILLTFNIMGVAWVSWWIVPYPFLLYMTYIALLFLFGAKAVNLAVGRRITKKKSK